MGEFQSAQGLENFHPVDQSKNENNREGEIVENIRNNPYFVRLCKGFLRYQELLTTPNISGEEKQQFLQRMHELHRIGDLNVAKQNTEAVFMAPADVDDVFEYALRYAETGDFNPEQFLQYLRKNPEILIGLSEEWNPKSGDSKLGEYEYVNSLVAFTKKDDETISLHILPAGTLKPSELITKVVEGFRKIAHKISLGEISCKHIEMKSWMLGKGLQEKITPLFSKMGDINIHEIDQNTEDVVDIQRLALLFNTKSLEHYLRTGIPPEVRAAEINSKNFTQAFVN